SKIQPPAPRPPLKLVRMPKKTAAAEALEYTDWPIAQNGDGGVEPSEVTELQDAWRKFHRANELFHAEQEHLKANALALQERETAVALRLEDVIRREALVAEREQIGRAS